MKDRNLSQALGLGEREMVSFVGAGGKKTAMKQLVTETTSHGNSAGYTSTTQMPPPDYPIVLKPPDIILEALHNTRRSPLAFAREQVADSERGRAKVTGFDPPLVDKIFESGRFDWVLVKADGARMREFKAPAEYEPPIPTRSTTVVPVVSAHIIGQPLLDTDVQRVDHVASITGLNEGDRISPESVGTVLASREGGMKNVPDSAQVVPLVNKVDSPSLEAIGEEILEQAFTRNESLSKGVIASIQKSNMQVVRS